MDNSNNTTNSITPIIIFDNDRNDNDGSMKRALRFATFTSTRRRLGNGNRTDNYDRIGFEVINNKNMNKNKRNNIVNSNKEKGIILDGYRYSKGIKWIEFNPGQYALEVHGDDSGGGSRTSSDNSNRSGTIQIFNPFLEDRMAYLSYMTTSAIAAANKVYPKTKIRIIDEVHSGQRCNRTDPKSSTDGLSTPCISTSAIIIDPSYDDNNDDKHRVRTTAVGFIPANSMVSLEFTPLETFTVHNFYITGISFSSIDEIQLHR